MAIQPDAPVDQEVPEQLLTAEGTAKYLKVTRQTIYNEMGRGLPSIKVGSARRFIRSEVDAFYGIKVTS